MNQAATGAPQGPVLEPGAGCGNVPNLRARLAFGTTRLRRRAKGLGCCIGQNTPLWDQAGALPESVSPMDADGRAVINELCRLDGADRWSILLTFGNLIERRRAND
jgi:hypothetical protein